MFITARLSPVKVLTGGILIFALFSSVSFAGRPLPIATSEFPPFEFRVNGAVVGIDSEIVERVLIRAGYTPEFQMLPWARALKYAQTGKVAAVFSLTKNPEREKFCYFSDELNRVKDVFFKLKQNKITWNTMGDLRPYTIGISRGYSYAPVFMKALEGELFQDVSVISGDNLELRSLKKIKAGYIDLSICEISVGQYLINKHAPNFDMIDYIDTPVGKVRPYFIGFSKMWPGARKIRERFNAELKKFIAEGNRKAIFRKYNISSPYSNQAH